MHVRGGVDTVRVGSGQQCEGREDSEGGGEDTGEGRGGHCM